MSEPMGVNVNLTGKLPLKLTFKLGRLMRQILLYLYNDSDHVHQQVEIIKALHGNITPSKKASFSRAIKLLRKAGLVGSRNAYFSDELRCWVPQRVRYFITDEGIEFVKKHLKTNTRGKGFSNVKNDKAKLLDDLPDCRTQNGGVGRG